MGTFEREVKELRKCYDFLLVLVSSLVFGHIKFMRRRINTRQHVEWERVVRTNKMLGKTPPVKQKEYQVK